ncbi:MAG: hypothetical protein HYS41_03505 [Candidatus Omnitrophica bacterium]|nr:hypothetical protein [Candidatus Omnitrophota bacterium]
MKLTWVLVAVGGLMAAAFQHELGAAPILGALLCAACFLRPRDLFWVGLGGMLVRELAIGISVFSAVRLVAVALVAAALVALKVRPSFRSILTGLLVSSPIFHLSLSVGDWLTGFCGVWPKTAAGLTGAIVTALPYFQRSLVGDFLFSSLFLGLYTGLAYWTTAVRTRAAS